MEEITLKKGKLYKVIKPLPIILEKDFVNSDIDIFETRSLPRHSIFIFIDYIHTDLQKYCKILFKDKICVTHNSYFISDSIVEYELLENSI